MIVPEKTKESINKQAFKQKKLLKIEGGGGFEIENISVKAKPKPNVQYLVFASEMGFSIALPILLGAFFGSWLDVKFNTQPKLTLSLLFIGIFFAFTNLFLIVKQFINKDKDKK